MALGAPSQKPLLKLNYKFERKSRFPTQQDITILNLILKGLCWIQLNIKTHMTGIEYYCQNLIKKKLTRFCYILKSLIFVNFNYLSINEHIYISNTLMPATS